MDPSQRVNNLPMSQTQLTHSSDCNVADHDQSILPVDVDEKTCTSSVNKQLVLISEDDKSEKKRLFGCGYIKTCYIADSLQGSIFCAIRVNNNNIVVIKRASIELHQKGVTIQSNKMYHVPEDIYKEYKILKYLNSKPIRPSSIIEFIDFFQTTHNLYLVMNHGGDSFFNFVSKSHQLIKMKQLSLNTWQTYIKFMFYQVAVGINWLHNEANCCHFDISLENMTVQNNNFILQPNGKYTINQNIKIQICDFGLAEIFDPNKGFNSTKYCGKTAYKSPEVYGKQVVFDARKNDVWSLGVCLFVMSAGGNPYTEPSDKDKMYKHFIKTSKFAELLELWNRQSYVTVPLLSLIKKMMNVDQTKRYSIKDVLKSPWLHVYYRQTR